MNRYFPRPSQNSVPRVLASTLTALAAVAALSSLAPAAFAGEACSTLEDCPCVLEMVESSLGRGWVGIYMESDGEGWVVTEVVPDGPADAAGLAKGDRLMAMNGVPMSREREKDLAKIYKNMVPGSKLVYSVERGGSKKDIDITLGKLPEKILSVILGQQLLERYAQTTGKKLDLPKPPAPKPPGKPRPPKSDGER